ncbi:hypothetical protein [Thermodesulfovibrio sp.]
MKTSIFIIFLMIFFTCYAEAKIQCVDSEGDAAITGNDIPSAKAEAISRAKWNAVEQVAGIKIKAQTVVQNFILVDDAIVKKTEGVISKYNIKKEWKDRDSYKVILNVCVETNKVDDAVSKLALNNSLAVFIPAKKTKNEYHQLSMNEMEEENILSETLIGALTERGVTVVDVISNNLADARIIENAMKSGNYTSLRAIMYKTLSNLLLIGKVDYTISTKKGEDIGYGLKMPVNSVTATLTYRIVARQTDSNKIIILTSGTEQAKAMASNIDDAAMQSLKTLSEKFVPIVFEKITKYVNSLSKKILVKVEGVSDIDKHFEIKELLQNIAWVTEVEDRGLGEFMISYPENPVYLANSLNQKGFTVVNFSPFYIILKAENNRVRDN